MSQVFIQTLQQQMKEISPFHKHITINSQTILRPKLSHRDYQTYKQTYRTRQFNKKNTQTEKFSQITNSTFLQTITLATQ